MGISKKKEKTDSARSSGVHEIYVRTLNLYWPNIPELNPKYGHEQITDTQAPSPYGRVSPSRKNRVNCFLQ